MKRQTALRHLVEIAGLATHHLRLRDTEIGWPVEELWTAGDLLDDTETVEAGAVIMALDVPPQRLPWLARYSAGEWAGEQLRLPKRPLRWDYRPLGWPAWNHQHRRVVRFWTASSGLDDGVVEALREPRRAILEVVEPSREQLAGQLRIELPVSRRHLRVMVDRYWERGWRRQHSGYAASPEDHLWRAASAVTELQDALDDLDDLRR